MSGPIQFTQAQLYRAMAGESPEETPEEEQSEFEQAIAQRPRLAPAHKAPSKSKPSAPINVLKLAKARLREVNKELRRIKPLEQERVELERLIEAAAGPPKAIANGRVVGHIAPSKTSAK